MILGDPSSSAPRLSVLLEAQRAVYIEVPKVACSSIKVALARLLAIDLEAAGGNPHEVDFPEPESHEAGAKLHPNLYSFAFVRNPWDRLVSCYRDKVLGEVVDFTSFHPTRCVAYCLSRFDAFRPGMSFKEFVSAVVTIPDTEADDHFRSQYTFITNTRGDIAIDFVGRFETLAQDFRQVCMRLGLNGLELPRLQAAKIPRRYSEYYTIRTREMVARRFRQDIELFGYEFG